MSLYKRKDSPYWWVKIHHSGGCLQQSTGTTERKRAQEYHDKLKASLWEQEKLGAKPKYSWNEAVVRYLAETSHKASHADDKSHLRWLHPFLDGVALERIDRDRLDVIAQARKAEGASDATVNRTLEVLRAILRKAALEWDWIAKPPAIRMLPEPTRRIRWLTHKEADHLLQELPPHLAAMAKFSLETASSGQRDGIAVVAGRFGAPLRLGPSRPGQSAQGYRSAAIGCRGAGATCASGTPPGIRICVSRQAG